MKYLHVTFVLGAISAGIIGFAFLRAAEPGAVAAARDFVAQGTRAPGHIDSLIASIRPAVLSTMGQDADTTCRVNIRNTVLALRRCDPILKKMVDESEIEVVGAYYDLDSGVVTFMPD